LAVAAVGAVIAVRHRSSRSALRDRAAGRYRILAGMKIAAAGAGAAILGGLGQGTYIPAFVCAVVGVHFFALAPDLGDRLPIPLGAATCAVAGLALVLRGTNGVAPSTTTGIGAGCMLTMCALATLAPGRHPAGSASDMPSQAEVG
jgi:hypothetical protein